MCIIQYSCTCIPENQVAELKFCSLVVAKQNAYLPGLFQYYTAKKQNIQALLKHCKTYAKNVLCIIYIYK